MSLKKFFRQFCLLTLALVLASSQLFGQRGYTLHNSSIEAVITREGISSLISLHDPYKADVVGQGAWVRPVMKYRILEGDWLDIFNGARSIRMNSDSSVTITDYQPGMPQKMEQRYYLTDDGLDVDITIESMMKWAFTIGDLGFRFDAPRPGGGSPEHIFEECYTTHRYISGHGSFIYYSRPSGNPPYLVLLPKEGTSLEYFDNNGVYVHSFLSGNSVTDGTWRQEHTTAEVAAAGEPGSRYTVGFRFRWADSYDEIRDILYEEGLFDISVVPGMTVPSDLTARFALRTKNMIDSVTAEYPSETNIEYLGEKETGNHIYRVKFNRLGENLLTVHYGEGFKTILEFFSTEPLETLIKKRSDFIVNSQQHRDPSEWYNGLYSIYDMGNSVLRSPDDTDGFDYWWGYVLACDDPALSKAPYVAAKNIWFPDQKEIESVEYYLENFVWDGLQRTDTDDPYPYGIYGVPNWKVARDIDARAGIRSRQLDRMQVWRSYDYPHIAMLYYHMYQVAKYYPEMVNYLDADGYLERAFGTAKAFFLYPYEIWGEYYKAYEIACYNELVIEDIIAALEENGRQEDADWLRGEYEKKVKYFIYDNKYPFSSEYSFDRTAFESSHAFARYGVLNSMAPDSNLWYDKIREVWYSHPDVSSGDARDFMERQLLAGLTVRGWLETSYYQLGADNGLSYMAKMGGWSILDYAKFFAEDPYPWLRLGYASYLSSWALMNSGTEESDYGYWSPGKENDGAMGWAFISSKRGRAWIGKEYGRGAWMYDGEADLGNGAAVRMAETVLAEDPLFGWIAYGGVLSETRKGFAVVPSDGIRGRFSVVTDDVRASLVLERDGFAEGGAVELSGSADRINFRIENRSGGSHLTGLKVQGFGVNAEVRVGGKRVEAEHRDSFETGFMLPVNGKFIDVEVVLHSEK
jgi:hypothetical protein